MEHMLKNSIFVVDEYSLSLFFVPEHLTPRLGMQPNKNLITFEWTLMFCRNCTVVFLKYAKSSSKLWCLLELLISPSSDALVYVYEWKCNSAETFPGFPYLVDFSS